MSQSDGQKELNQLYKALVPNVVSYVEIEWRSYISFKAYASEIPALVDWCKSHISVTTGYAIDPIRSDVDSAQAPALSFREQILSDDFSGIKKEVVELSKGQEVLLAKTAIDAAQKESGFVVGSEINEEALELFSSILEKKLIAQEIAIKQGVESTIKDMKQQIEHFKKHGDQWEAELIEDYCETLEELISKKS